MAYIEFVDRPVIIPEVDEQKKPSRSRRPKQAEATA